MGQIILQTIKVNTRVQISDPIVHRGEKSPTWKTNPHPNEPIPTRNDIT